MTTKLHGVVDMTADAYHRHEALSSSGARKLLPPSCQVVASPRVLLLRPEQVQPRRQPFLACPAPVRRRRHRSYLLSTDFTSIAAPTRSSRATR